MNPAYFAVIPASVRYADVPQGAKLLYGEITALASKEGYCWATNGYFAKLYGVTPRTVQRWVSCLEALGFVFRGDENGDQRQLFLGEGATKMSPPHDKNVTPPHDKNVTQNNTRVSKTLNKYGQSEIAREFDELWPLIPDREGSNPRKAALSAYKARRKTRTADEICRGVVRYAKYCEAKQILGTEFVMQAKRLLGPNEEFLRAWRINENSQRIVNKTRQTPADRVRAAVSGQAGGGGVDPDGRNVCAQVDGSLWGGSDSILAGEFQRVDD